MENNIKIYVICHKDYYIPSINFLRGLQVGTVFSDKKFINMYQDNDGNDNISYLNKSYCELTGQYWVWKNSKSNIVGFFHYRRYLKFFSNSEKPYIIEKKPDTDKLIGYGYKESSINKIFEKYDLIVPYPEKMYKNVYQHYIDAQNHYKKDIDIIIKIVKENYPEMKSAMEKYLNNENSYFGNIYIMKWNIFDKYMQWLFSILLEFDVLKEDKKYNIQAKRVDGYLAERLFGIYLTHLIDNGIKVYFTQKIHYECFEHNNIIYYKNSFINKLLPPGSYRRYLVKKVINIVKEKL